MPASALSLPPPERLTWEDRGDRLQLTARTLINLAFDQQPDIKSSFQRYQSEEARYDFFYASRDSLTPQLRVTNRADEARADNIVTRVREHTIDLNFEKRFFDTTQFDFGVGLRNREIDDDMGNTPFVAARLRYPFWASREKLERTSEDIFRRNELNDAQLAYIQEVRRRLQQVLFDFYEVLDLSRRVEHARLWRADLEDIVSRLNPAWDEQRLISDRSRLQAEITRVSAEMRNTAGKFEVEYTRLRAAAGIPFHIRPELIDEPFNPFAGIDHLTLLQLSIETDPEIATLRNAMRNAEVQLDLARRGRWDIAMLLAGDSNLEGRGRTEGVSDWSVTLGFDVSAVDPRVTDSLTRQAQANIARFQQAIAARENNIFADTFEPIIRIETLSQSRDELIANMARFESDYRAGAAAFLNGNLSIDDLLKRRELIFQQQVAISELKFLVGANVAELCAATGKFFEFLDGADK